MRCTVVWVPSAEDQLALLWVQSPDRQAVADAANRIERALAKDPDLKGHPEEDYRVYVDAPLVVAYQVFPDDRLVRIADVARC